MSDITTPEDKLKAAADNSPEDKVENAPNPGDASPEAKAEHAPNPDDKSSEAEGAPSEGESMGSDSRAKEEAKVDSDLKRADASQEKADDGFKQQNFVIPDSYKTFTKVEVLDTKLDMFIKQTDKNFKLLYTIIDKLDKKVESGLKENNNKLESELKENNKKINDVSKEIYNKIDEVSKEIYNKIADVSN
jgi:hypothetical protein